MNRCISKRWKTLLRATSVAVHWYVVNRVINTWENSNVKNRAAPIIDSPAMLFLALSVAVNGDRR